MPATSFQPVLYYCNLYDHHHQGHLMANQMGAEPSLHDAASLHDSYMRSTSPCATHTCLVCPNLGPGRHPKARPYRNPNPSSASYAPGRPYVAPRYPRYPALGRPVTGGTLPGLGGRESRLIPAATAAAPRRQTGDQREACAERFWRVSAILLSEGQLELDTDPESADIFS